MVYLRAGCAGPRVTPMRAFNSERPHICDELGGRMSNGAGGYTPLLQLLGEIGKAQDAGATVAALAMVYIGLDTMALLTCPVGQQSQTRADFISWVDKYLKADAASEYQYEGIDMYAARCAVLHSYGSVAALHSGTNPPRKFGYTDNGPHKKDDAERFALISVAVLIHDFSKAMESFIKEMRTDPELKRRIDSRIGSLFFTSLVGH
jgi:hypothetical protein